VSPGFCGRRLRGNEAIERNRGDAGPTTNLGFWLSCDEQFSDGIQDLRAQSLGSRGELKPLGFRPTHTGGRGHADRLRSSTHRKTAIYKFREFVKSVVTPPFVSRWRAWHSKI
jgi:hypothetical protein